MQSNCTQPIVHQLKGNAKRARMVTQPLVSSTRLKLLSRVSKTEANKQSVNSSSRVVLQTTKRGYKIQYFVLASLQFKNKSGLLF